MLYSELDKLVGGKGVFHKVTMDEYNTINAAYMASLGTESEMSKEDAAAMWHAVYGERNRKKQLQKKLENKSLKESIIENCLNVNYFCDINERYQDIINQACSKIRSEPGFYDYRRCYYYRDNNGIKYKAKVKKEYNYYEVYILNKDQEISTHVTLI